MTLFRFAFEWGYFLRKWSILNGGPRPAKDTIIEAMYRVTVLRDNKPIVGPKRFLEKLAAEKARDRLQSRFPHPCEVLLTPSTSSGGRDFGRR